MRKFRVFLAVLAVLLVAGVASAQTTLDLKGFIRVYPEVNNYGYTKIALDKASKTQAFVDQRARLFFNLKSGDNVGGTVALEFDSRWGDAAYTTSRNKGGALEADTTNAETKNAYLWFKPNSDLKLTLGIQGYFDDYYGVILGGADMAGIRADYTISKESSLSAGYYVWADQNVNKSSDAVYFIPVSYKQSLGDGKLGVSFYILKDNAGSSAWDGVQPFRTGLAGETTYLAPGPGTTNAHITSYGSASVYYLGANYSAKAGDIDYAIAALYNFGTVNNAPNKDADISAYLLHAMADMKLGSGKLKARLLYSSGDNSTTDYNGVVTGNQYSIGSDLPLLCTDIYILMRTLEDNSQSVALVPDVNNGGRGVTLGYVSYNQNLSDKTNAQVGLAYAQASDDSGLAGSAIGTEINAQLKYNFSKNLTVTGVLAYAFVGDGVKAKNNTASYDDLYRAFVKFNYAF